MSRKHLGFILGAAILCAAQSSHAAPILVDGFETANLAAPTGPSPAINTNGFSWSGTNYTQVVGVVNGQPTAVYGGRGVISDVWSGSNFSCISGNYCLRFYYPAGQYQSEQRFNIGTAQRDVWLRYWLRVPTNFTHPTAGPNNQKFLALWMDGYEGQGTGSTVWLSFLSNGAGGSTLVFTSNGGQGSAGTLVFQQEKPFISVPADRGRWMEIVFHVRASTSRTSNDGVIETWRRWSNETSLTKLHETRTANIAPSPTGPMGWQAGYLMGWANGAYAVDTDWLLDDFTISTEPLATSSASAPATTSPPSAPLLQIR